MKNRFLTRSICLMLSVMFGMNFLNITALASNSTSNAENIESSDSSKQPDIIISNAKELVEFADVCKLGSYSQGLVVTLACDIKLTEGDNFTGIDSFSGIFDGNNHTITGFNLDSGNGALGFFGYVEKGGIVRNLRVNGSVSSKDDNDYIGIIAGVNGGIIENCQADGTATAIGDAAGIAGLNGANGIVRGCTNEAEVESLKSVAGIAGENKGNIYNCVNNGNINSDDVWLSFESESVTSLSIDSLVDKFEKSLDQGNDIGGISGISLGTISDCTNNGIVGYQHAGKNVGGIVGRFTGKVTDCTNNGNVYGKQDVGGIAGQFEPTIVGEGSSLDTYIDGLENSAKRLGNDINEISSSSGQALDKMADSIDEAAAETTQDVTDASGKITDTIHKQNEEIDRRLGGVTKTIERFQTGVNNASEEIKEQEENFNFEKIINRIDQINESVDATSKSFKEYDASRFEMGARAQVDSAATDVYTDVNDVRDSINDSVEKVAGDYSSSLRELSRSLTEAQTTLNNDFQDINGRIADISAFASDKVDNLKRIAEGGDVIEDYSAIDSENESASRIIGCLNRGYINGDRNTGGIAGAIGIEGLDKEDVKATDTKQERYVTIAVLDDCESEGLIEFRRENAGGIAGYMELGLVANSIGQNRIYSEEGNYLGGISGYSCGTIKNCLVSSTLEGANYVGGIVGTGRRVRYCYANAKLSNKPNWVGEIIGNVLEDSSNDITVSHSKMMESIFNNYYLDDTYGGINNTSYKGIAEKIEYDNLLAIDEGASVFSPKVYFYDLDKKLIQTDSMSYGSSIEGIEFPKLSRAKDTYISWDGFDETTITGNIFSIVSEKDDVKVLASKTKYCGKPLVLVSGRFLANSQVLVETVSDLEPPVKNRKGSVIHMYKVSIENTNPDEDEAQEVRFFVGKDVISVNIYERKDDKWELKPNEIKGSYVETPLDGNEAIFAIETYEGSYSNLVKLGLVLLTIVLIIVITIIREKKKGKEKKEGS